MRCPLALLLVQLGCLQVSAQEARRADPVALALDDDFRALAFSPDGGTVYGGGGENMFRGPRPHVIRAWDSASGKLRWEQREQPAVSSLAVSPDGTIVASAPYARGILGPTVVRLWDAASGKPIGKLEGHQESIFSLAFSPDGARLVSAGGDGTVRVWDVASWKQVATGRSPWMAATQAAFLPDGKSVLFGSQSGILTVWEWESGKEIASARGHKGDVVSLSVSSVGRHVATVGNDQILRLTDTASLDQGVTLPGPEGKVYRAAFSPDGRFLASLAEDGLRIWELATRKEAWRIESAWAAAVFSPDGRRIATGIGNFDGKVWDLAALATAEKIPDAAKALRDADAKAAYRSAWGLVLQGDAGVAWLKPRLLTPPSAEAVAKAFTALDDDEIRVRESAFQELLGYGPAIEAEVKAKLLAGPPEQLKRPLEDLKRRLDGPIAGSPYLMERTRSIFVLETIGSAAAIAVLEELSRSGKSALERTEAAASLKRLKK